MNQIQVNIVNALMEEIHHDNVGKGFWDEDRNEGEAIMLMVTELAEGFEDCRKGKEKSDKIPAFSPMEEELADCIIRILDWCGGKDYRVAEAMQAKLEYNKTRAYKHGKKF